LETAKFAASMDGAFLHRFKLALIDVAAEVDAEISRT
jgi:hypothetical protein